MTNEMQRETQYDAETMDTTLGTAIRPDPQQSHATERPPATTRIFKACRNCRRQKMKCLGSSNSPCPRCRNSGVECVFDEVGRRKRPHRDRSGADKWKSRYGIPTHVFLLLISKLPQVFGIASTDRSPGSPR